MTFALMTFAIKFMLLQLPPSLDASSTECKNCLLEENFKGNLVKNLSTQ